MQKHFEGKKINVDINDDVKQLESLASNVVTPHTTPPIQEKMPSTFVVLLKECLKYEHHECSRRRKLTWGNKLAMRCSRRTQLYELIVDNSKNTPNAQIT